MPLDPKKVGRCKSDIQNAYARDSRVQKIVNLRKVPVTDDAEFTKLGVSCLVDRSWFIELSKIPVFSELGSAVARDELKFLIKNSIQLATTPVQIHKSEITPDRLKGMLTPVLGASSGFLLLVPLWVKYDLLLKQPKWCSSYNYDLASFVINLEEIRTVPILGIHEDFINNNIVAVNHCFATLNMQESDSETQNTIFISINDLQDTAQVEIGAWSLVKLDQNNASLISVLSIEG